MGMIAPEDLGLKLPSSGSGPIRMFDIWEDFEPYSTGGLSFINTEKMKRQRAAIFDFLKSAGKHIFTGAFFKISMPVGLCEPRSFLERMPDQWAYIPSLLSPVAKPKVDPVERMKKVIAFAISGLHLTVRMEKPFNPILGETYQGEFSDGTKVFLEQVSHHPPISSWLVIGPDNSFRYHGSGESYAKFKTNSVTVGMKTKHTIEFSDGGKICFWLPMFNISGVVLGTRVIEYFGNCVFYDEANDLVAHLRFKESSAGYFSWGSSDKDAKTDLLTGFLGKGCSLPELDATEVKADGTVLSEVTGSWIGQVKFGDKVYWDIKGDMFPEVPRAVPLLLESDCRFRTDVRAVAKGDWSLAEKEKLRLEQIQRNDRKLRAELSPTPSKKDEPMSPS